MGLCGRRRTAGRVTGANEVWQLGLVNSFSLTGILEVVGQAEEEDGERLCASV